MTRAKNGAAPGRHYRDIEVIALHDAGKTHAEIAANANVGKRQVRHIIERELARRETAPLIDPSTLSLTAQQKLDLAIRQAKQALALDFHKAVQVRVDQRLDEYWLPEHKRLVAWAKDIMDNRRGIMDKATFDSIRRCLHPDSRKTASDERLAEAFDAFMALEKRLLKEEESPTNLGPDLPKTAEELMKYRAAHMAPRKPRGHYKRPATRNSA